MVVAGTRIPSLASSTSIRTQPHRWFSLAILTTRSRTSGSIGGLPGGLVFPYVQFSLTSSRWQRRSVAGATRRQDLPDGVLDEAADRLSLYYGAGDSVVGLAEAHFSDLMEYMAHAPLCQHRRVDDDGRG
jgi:hypothetical protein